jgi:ribonuclease-3
MALPVPPPVPLDELEARLGLVFHNKRLLLQALTHPSFLNEPGGAGLQHFERLEFLGDAFLTYVAADYLYHTFPELDEGRLTVLRSALVRAGPLARYAAALDLGRYLLLGRGERRAGGQHRPSILARAFEALVGAVLVDQGHDVAKAFALRFLRPEAERVLAEQTLEDPKSRLQAEAQRRFGITPRYRQVAVSGPPDSPHFEFEVLVGDRVLGRGSGPSKQAAQQAAAQAALEHLPAA